MINMHPQTVEAISIVLEGLKISYLSDMCCGIVMTNGIFFFILVFAL